MLTWTPFVLVVSAVIYFIFDSCSSPQTKSGDLALFLRRVNLRMLEDLLDPVNEAALRASLSARGFRCAQRMRILGAREQIRRIAHNARIFRRWSTQEYEQIKHKNRAQFGDEEALIIQLVRTSDEVKWSAIMACWKLTAWRLLFLHLWVFLPSPSLSDVREVLDRDLLHCYESMTSNAGQILLCRNGEHYEAVRAAL